MSVEVFGAWFTKYGKSSDAINPTNDVRIHPPTKGLQDFFDLRANILNKHIKAVRDAKAAAAPRKSPKKEEPKPAPTEEPKKKKPKKEEAKKKSPRRGRGQAG